MLAQGGLDRPHAPAFYQKKHKSVLVLLIRMLALGDWTAPHAPAFYQKKQTSVFDSENDVVKIPFLIKRMER
jgi:hypothetical protein